MEAFLRMTRAAPVVSSFLLFVDVLRFDEASHFDPEDGALGGLGGKAYARLHLSGVYLAKG